MKKNLLFAFGAMALAITSTLTAAVSIDEELFVAPSLLELAGKLSFDAAMPLAVEKKATYDYAYSLNIGQNLTSTAHVVSKDTCRIIGLEAHFSQLADSLLPTGRALIITPASYDTLFTDGSVSDAQAKEHIMQVLAKIGESDEKQLIINALSDLNEVRRATFVRRRGHLELVTDEKTLVLGEKVWRKMPEGVSEEIYHSEEEYLVAIKNAGLVCVEIRRPCFFSEMKRNTYNEARKEGEAKLGVAYVNNHPFTLFVVSKATKPA